MGILDGVLEALGLKKKEENEPAEGAGPPPAQEAAPPPPEPEQDEDEDEDSENETGDDEDSEDEDSEDDESWERDYDREDVDDSASFNLEADLKGWFAAEKQIEAAWEDKEQRRQVLAQHGIQDEPHFYQVQATVERFCQSPQAAAIYGGPNDIVQLQLDAATDGMKAAQQQRAEEMSAELEPVDGVSLQQWAQAQVKVAQGGAVDDICAEAGIDRAKWDAVSAEWNDRMSRDSTATIATEYGKYFTGAGEGQFAGAGAAAADAMTTPGASVGDEEPYPFEKWVEISVAMDKGTAQGKDPQGILQEFGMTAADWGISSGWWSMKFHGGAYGEGLKDQYDELLAKFEAKYAAADPDDDVDF
jgi:Family of unknown function (DUF6620)